MQYVSYSRMLDVLLVLESVGVGTDTWRPADDRTERVEERDGSAPKANTHGYGKRYYNLYSRTTFQIQSNLNIPPCSGHGLHGMLVLYRGWRYIEVMKGSKRKKIGTSQMLAEYGV